MDSACQGEAMQADEPNIRRYRIHHDADMQEQFSIAHASFELMCEFDSQVHWRRYVDGAIHEQFSAALRPGKSAATVIQFHEPDA